MVQEQKYTDSVCIAVSPVEPMSKVVRLATTAVASRVGLNIDQSDDLNTALDELFRQFLAWHPGGNNFCVRYNIHPDRLEILAEGCADFTEEPDNVGHYSRFLLESLSDQMEKRPNPEGGFDILLVKLLTNH